MTGRTSQTCVGKLRSITDDVLTNSFQKQEAKVAPPPEPAPKLTKAQKRAQHLQQQKQLWDSAENPDRFHWLESQGVVPLKQELKPQVKLLSRKPVAPVLAKKDGGSLEDGESDEEGRKQREADTEERQRKAKLEREEKQRKYAEARERIMGSPAPNTASRDSSHGRDTRKPRGKVNGMQNSQPTSSADQSPARPGTASSEHQLFDPEDMGRRLPKREMNSIPHEDQPSRQPKGPENNGRGGFGFAGRGGKGAS